MERTLIASAFSDSENFLKNYQNHQLAINALRNMGLKPIEGVGKYNGIHELSLVVKLPFPLFDSNGRDIYNDLRKLFFSKYNQESLLYINEFHVASLIYWNGKRETLGSWKEISREIEVEKLDSFTYFDGRYFSTE